MAELVWSYGVTTVPSRLETTLPRTLKSLFLAGFDQPRLFVDGTYSIGLWQPFGLEITPRYPRVRTFGNWYMSLMELYIRNPFADRYAMFQDDFVTYRHLRCYLEKYPMPVKSYLNLHTLPSSSDNGVPLPQRASQAAPPSPEYVGWYNSNQLGRGAVALVFTREGVTEILKAEHMVMKPQSMNAPRVVDGEQWNSSHNNVDGAISDSLRERGFVEYVHSPSLVKHIGEVSSMGSNSFPPSLGFKGEEYNALDFLT